MNYIKAGFCLFAFFLLNCNEEYSFHSKNESAIVADNPRNNFGNKAFEKSTSITKQIVPFLPLGNRINGTVMEWAPSLPLINGSVGTILTNTSSNSVFSIDIPLLDDGAITKINLYYQVNYPHYPSTKLSAKITKFFPSDPSIAIDVVVAVASGTDSTSYFNAGSAVSLQLNCFEKTNHSFRYILTVFGESDVGGSSLLGASVTYTILK